jgi:tetratricopeptide (TPR) repeat protein
MLSTQPRTGRCALAGGRGTRYASPMPDKEELYDRAIDLFSDGKLEEAIAVYRSALDLAPDYVDAWHGLAMAYNELKQYDKAIEAGKRLCELAPDDTLAHTSLSRFYQAAGMIPEAEAEGAKARVLDWKRQLKEAGPKPS